MMLGHIFVYSLGENTELAIEKEEDGEGENNRGYYLAKRPDLGRREPQQLESIRE